jgi:hypothetical protein
MGVETHIIAMKAGGSRLSTVWMSCTEFANRQQSCRCEQVSALQKVLPMKLRVAAPASAELIIFGGGKTRD